MNFGLPWGALKLGESSLGAGFSMFLNDKTETSTPNFLRQAVVVMPTHKPASRRQALNAVTKGLKRHKGLEVSAIKPALFSEIRRYLNQGALLLHLDSVDGDNCVFDDGVYPLTTLETLGYSWLTILGGSASCARAAETRRQLNSALTIFRTFDVDPKVQAAFERTLFQALASGSQSASAFV